MKILLISHARNDENAGASRIYHLLADALRKRGHAVTLYHYEDLRVPGFLNYFVQRAALPEFIFWRFYKEATRNYDVIFSSNGMAYRVYQKLRTRSVRPRLIHHLHGLTYFDYLAVVTEKLRGHVKLSPLVRALKIHFAIRWDAQGARYADVIVAQNLRDQDYLQDQRSQGAEGASVQAPIVQVPAALHPRIEEASHEAAPPENRNPMSILWFGSWRERKGNYYVNRAFLEVKKRFPSATLTLGGTGCDAPSVEAFFDPELRSSIRVLPRIDIETQIREYNAHSLFIFPSLSEGFGLALIEAMAMGLACVTTQTGVGSDWIVDGEHAVVVAMASSEHLALGMMRFLQDDALRVQVARKGQKLAKEFTVERCVDAYLEVFERRPVDSRTPSQGKSDSLAR